MTPTPSDHSTEAVSTDRVEAALRQVEDPDAGVTVFEAGLVEDIAIEEGTVTIEADLTDFDPRGREQVMGAMMRAVDAVAGVQSVHVEPVAPSTDGAPGLQSVDTVVAVASAKGGVGKTTVATTLACALADDADVGLFDADIHGPNVPRLLDVEGPVHSDADGNPLPVETDGLSVMSVGLMESGAPLAWRGAMAHDALTELFEETAWGDLDTLVVDLPPGTGDIVLTTLQEVPVDGVVVVTTPFAASVDDTRRSIELFAENDVPVLGAVCNMGSFTCPSCGDEHALYPDGDPRERLDAPVLAELPFTTEMQRRPAPGDVPDRTGALAETVRNRLDEVWNVPVPEGAVDLRGVPPEERRSLVRQAVAEGRTDPFRLVSDRDPRPVLSFIADLDGVDERAITGVEVTQPNPETWLLQARL